MNHSRKPKAVLQLDPITKEVIFEHKSMTSAAKAVGLRSNTGIFGCCSGKAQTAQGFAWKYADDKDSTPMATSTTSLTLEENRACFDYFKKILSRTPAAFSEKFSDELLKAMEEYADSLAFADELIKEKEMMLLKTL